MSGQSTKTVPRSLRIEKDIDKRIIKDMAKQVFRPDSYNSFVNRALRKQLLRKHVKAES